MGQIEVICIKHRDDLVQPFEPFGEGSSRLWGRILRLIHGFVPETLELTDLVVYRK